jgi:hypothetical protein
VDRRFLDNGYFYLRQTAAQEKGQPLEGLEEAWYLEGRCTGVVSDDENAAIYVLRPRGTCVELDSAGKSRREFKLANADGAVIRLAHFGKENGTVLLTFRVWGAELHAHDLHGKQLWKYQSGIDDVWAKDLNGDKSDEVIVSGGYNGDAGLHVLDSKGQVVWKTTDIGNVWHVDAGDLSGDGTRQVVTTSATRQVHVFGSDGKSRKDVDAGCYASMVRVGKSEKDKAATIFVIGTSVADQTTEILRALSGDGAQKWSFQLSRGARAHCESAQLAPGRPWLAVGLRGGQVRVVDVAKGEFIGGVADQGMIPEVGWAKRKDAEAPLLLVATGDKLHAFRVTKAK